MTEFLFTDWSMLSWTAVDYGGRPCTLTLQDIQWQHRGSRVEDEETEADIEQSSQQQQLQLPGNWTALHQYGRWPEEGWTVTSTLMTLSLSIVTQYVMAIARGVAHQIADKITHVVCMLTCQTVQLS